MMDFKQVIWALGELEYADMAAELSFVAWWFNNEKKPTSPKVRAKRILEKTKGLVRHDRVLNGRNPCEN